jgi:hypothetical protein
VDKAVALAVDAEVCVHPQRHVRMHRDQVVGEPADVEHDVATPDREPRTPVPAVNRALRRPTVTSLVRAADKYRSASTNPVGGSPRSAASRPSTGRTDSAVVAPTTRCGSSRAACIVSSSASLL